MVTKNQAEMIYDDYKIHIAKSWLPREGFYLIGIHEETGVCAANRPDSLAEHADGCAHLLGSLAMWCPDEMPEEMEKRGQFLMRYHDAPEIDSGDWADDGSRNDAAKDEIELKYMMEVLTAKWPRLKRAQFLADYNDFQKKNTSFGQMLYCIDKVEAPLRLIEYERRGLIKDITMKRKMSRQDERNMLYCGTKNPVDVWAKQALDRTYQCHGFDLLYTLLTIAMEDVRGKVPDWVCKYYKELQQKLFTETHSFF